MDVQGESKGELFHYNDRVSFYLDSFSQTFFKNFYLKGIKILTERKGNYICLICSYNRRRRKEWTRIILMVKIINIFPQHQ